VLSRPADAECPELRVWPRKSHLLIALGTEAAMHEYRVKYVLATKLVNEPVKAADKKLLAKTIARYGRVDLLCIDELGYMGLDRRGAELLFQVLTERGKRTLWRSPPTNPSEAAPRPSRIQGSARP
jgi:DNA replication protein DnaC